MCPTDHDTMAHEREKVIKRAVEVMDKAVTGYSVNIFRVRALYDAGLLCTQYHMGALAACEAMDHARSNGFMGWTDGADACADVGARSLASKAAAQESPLDRVKRAYKASKACGVLSGEVIDALDALVKED